MKVFLIYFLLFAFWAEHTLGFKLTQVPGLSLFNLAIYFLLIAWAYSIVFKKKLLEWNSANTYVIILIFIVILSIPYKILLDEVPKISLKREIIALKDWVDPFIIFFIIFNIIDNEKMCKRALLGLVILLFVTAISSPLISLGIINVVKTYDFYQGRAAGFSEPNQYAAYLVLFIPLIFTFMIFHKSYVFRMLSGLVRFSVLCRTNYYRITRWFFSIIDKYNSIFVYPLSW